MKNTSRIHRKGGKQSPVSQAATSMDQPSAKHPPGPIPAELYIPCEDVLVNLEQAGRAGVALLVMNAVTISAGVNAYAEFEAMDLPNFGEGMEALARDVAEQFKEAASEQRAETMALLNHGQGWGNSTKMENMACSLQHLLEAQTEVFERCGSSDCVGINHASRDRIKAARDIYLQAARKITGQPGRASVEATAPTAEMGRAA